MFFVKSKARTLRLRDMDSGKMQVVGPRAWVPFGALPANLAGSDDCDFDIRQPQTQQDLDAIEADNARMAGAPTVLAKPAPIADEPRPRRSRR